LINTNFIQGLFSELKRFWNSTDQITQHAEKQRDNRKMLLYSLPEPKVLKNNLKND